MRQRPPFIWTPRQPIHPFGFLSELGELGGLSSAGDGRQDGLNRWFLFRRPIELAEAPHTAPLSITCDGRYQLFVNGRRVGRGPVRSAAMAPKYDRHEIAPYLVTGENLLAVIVHSFGVDTAWYEMVRGMWQPTFGEGGLWVEGAAHGDGATVRFDSGSDWKVTQSNAWESETERMNSGLGFIEFLDARRLPEDWKGASFDDSAWDDAAILHVDGGGPDAFFGGIDVEPFPILAPNPLPPLAESVRRPEQMFAAYRVRSQPNLPVHRALYEEDIVANDTATADQWRELGDAPLRIELTNGEGISLLYKFDALLTGYPFIELDAAGGEVIDIALAESLPGEYEGTLPKMPRIVRRPVLGHDAHIARYIAKPGRQRFERFEWSAARWMQITLRGTAGALAVHDAGVVHTHYPANHEGRFASDDPLLDRLWELGRTTLELCMHDGWEDCPSREQRQWLGDVTVEHAAAQAAFGPTANVLTAKYLVDVADSQRPDGLTQMFAPGDHKVNGLLIPDWTLQWILTAGDYLRYSGDVATIEMIFPAVQRALAWFEKLRISNGLIADLPYWHFMDWSAVGRKGEATTLNAQFGGALKAAAAMADALHYNRAGNRYRAAASEISAALNARHWDEVRGAYVDMVDPADGRQNLRISQHANAAMILWGDAPRERWERMVKRISDPARLTFTAGPPIVPMGEPLDEQEGVVLANTFYSHFVYAALGTAERTDLALELMRDRYGPMLQAGAVSLWESYGPTASLCHGFSASPTWQMTNYILGLKPDANGFDTLRFDPQLGGLRNASGALGTVHGLVEVGLRAEPDGVAATLNLPAGMDAIIGNRFVQSGKRLAGGTIHELLLTMG
jgi:alpha-L-rhamnosidase